MNKRPLSILFIMLVTLSFISCDRGDNSPAPLEELPTDVSVEFGEGKQTDHKVSTSYVAMVSGTEVVLGFYAPVNKDFSFTSGGICWSKLQNPSIKDDRIEEKSPSSRYHCHITGLELNTIYYYRPFVVYSGRLGYGDISSFTTPSTINLPVFNPDLIYGSMTDIDGNIYKTIKIGTQTWMAENLKTTRYNDGSVIPNITDNTKWLELKTGAYRWYENDEATFKSIYGAMYNWYTVNTGKLCPIGWHVSTDDEWIQLEIALGMTQDQANSWGEWPGIDSRGTDQGTQMKASNGWSYWDRLNGNGSNKSGFSALPAGETDWYGCYQGAGVVTTYWTSTSEGLGRFLGTDAGVGRGVYYAHHGFSVRCLKD